MLLKNVVIGSSVESAFYALLNECYFIPTLNLPPMFYNVLDIPILGLKTESEAWPKINLILGILSRRVAIDGQNSIKIVDNQIKITNGVSNFKYRFEKLFVFDPSGVQFENNIKTAKPKTFVVLDDFELSILGEKRYNLKPIIRKAGFASRLHFYSSDRVDGSNFITDCVVQSQLTQDQLNSFDYSDTMARFVVERHLNSIGVYGRAMAKYKSGKIK